MKRVDLVLALSAAAVTAALILPGRAHAVPRTAGAGGYWTNTATWTGGVVPGTGDGVTIGGPFTVTNDTASAALASLQVDGTLVYDGWEAGITATVVQVNGAVTHNLNTDTTGSAGTYADWTPDNRVYLSCSNLTVASGGHIDADAKGYEGGTPSGAGEDGKGPGGGLAASSDHGGGGGYGGHGQAAQNGKAGGIEYGSASMPTDPGSGGGGAYPYNATTRGGHGGGAIRIDAAGHVAVDGTVSANGENGVSGTAGGGSGGGIYITCRTFGGTGVIAVDGGNGDPHAAGYAGAGSGGRVAIVYDEVAQSGVPAPTVAFSAEGGFGGVSPGAIAEPGSLHLRDLAFFPTNLIETSFHLSSDLATNWVIDSLRVDNVWVILDAGGPVTVTHALLLNGNDAKLELLAPVSLQCAALTVTNGAGLYVYAGETNGATPAYGGAVTVDGAVRVAAGSAIYPHSHSSNGGSVKFTVGALDVDSGGAIDATGRGYSGHSGAIGYGPGGGNASDVGSGGGYGGVGGISIRGAPAGGITYGTSNAPVQCGSSGGFGWPGSGLVGGGGGLIWVEAAGDLTVDGSLTASGGAPQSGTAHGAGSGGGIYLTCETFAGAGALAADGGDAGSYKGGGGGGRIAVWRSFFADWTGTASVTNGPSNVSLTNVGSIVWGYLLPNRPGISNAVPTNIQVNAASLNGYLFTTGRSATAASVYWGPEDQTTNASLWARTNSFASPLREGTLTANVTMSGDVQMQYYRFYAHNPGGDFWAAYTEWFLPGELNLSVLQGTAYEDGILPGTVVVSRASTATNGDIQVNYTVTGAAANGDDYDLLSSNVTLLAGAATANIVIQPIWDPDAEGDESVVITLAAGKYAVGAANTAAVSIVDFVVPPGYNTNLNSGAWGNVATWSLARPPIAGDHVIIATNVTLDQSTPALSSLTVNASAALTFDGTHTILTATAVTVNGTLSHDENSDTGAPWEIDGSVHIVCDDFTLAAGAVIDVDEKGYQGGVAISDGRGPGGPLGSTWAYGAGYGGRGGPHGNDGNEIATANGQTYGAAEAPIWPGSSGVAGHTSGTPGVDGGGLVRIHASDTVTLNGTITADGGSASTAGTIIGGGSGGGVYITCRTIEGIAEITATGGDGSPWNSTDHGGGGGGGRIAIVYDTAAQAGVAAPTITFAVGGGRGGDTPFIHAEPGTVYLSDVSFHSPTTFDSPVYLIVSNLTAWSPSNILVDDVRVKIQAGLDIDVVGNVVVTGGEGRLDLLAPSALSCANLSLVDGGQVWFTSGPTNAGQPDGGALLEVPGELLIGADATLHLVSDSTNGGSAWLEVGDLTVDADGKLDADGNGFRGHLPDNTGRGYSGGHASDVGAGAGHGGIGGDDSRDGVWNAGTYGVSNAPIHAGSAGGHGSASSGMSGYGGGVVRVVVADRLTVDGTISASGQAPVEAWGYNGYSTGGGSGGSIYLTARQFSGSGLLRADGGAGGSYLGGLGPGGGGGGRIAVWRVNTESCSTSVAGGKGFEYGGAGTVVWYQTPAVGTVLMIR